MERGENPVKDYKLSAEALVMTAGSSVGTQAKYYDRGYWYKADRTGAESTAEYLMSLVLSCSDIPDYVTYEKCTINGRAGCRSKSFLGPDESFISFQRLYDMFEGGNLSERILPMKRVEDRIDFVKTFVLDYTDVDCSEYLSRILTLDMLSLNTDRHFHNLGIITNRKNSRSRPAPVFDNADVLLCNYTKFEPDEEIGELLNRVYAQPFSSSHEIQAKAAGLLLRLDYPKLEALLDKEPDSRALRVLRYQLERYREVLCGHEA